MPLLNYTTSVPVEKSVAEITKALEKIAANPGMLLGDGR